MQGLENWPHLIEEAKQLKDNPGGDLLEEEKDLRIVSLNFQPQQQRNGSDKSRMSSELSQEFMARLEN